MINILKSKLSVTELNELLDNLLQQAMVMNKTKAGTLQIINAKEQSLELIVSFGLDTTFTEHFKKVMINDGSVCARALERGETIFIEDLRQDRSFAPHLPVALQNNITAVQSTPMISQNGNIVGIMSTHFKLPRKPSKVEIAKFQNFCRNAAVIIEEYILN
jgi:GAF domain-containing protein